MMMLKTIAWAVRHPRYAWSWYVRGKPFNAGPNDAGPYARR